MLYDLALFEQLNEEYRDRPVVDIAKIRRRRALLSSGQGAAADKKPSPTPEQRRGAAIGQLKPVLNDLNLTGKTVLELGCANGWMTSVLPEHAGVARAIGVDVARYAGWATHTDPRVSFIVADLSRERTVPPDSIDTVISSATFEHIERPLQMLSALHDVLRDGGEAWLRMNVYTAANASHRYTEVFFPWPHLLFTDEVCEQYYEKHRKRSGQRFSWVNRMTVAHYVHAARDLGFQITLARRQIRPIDVPFYLRFVDQLGRYAALDLETNFLTLVLRKGAVGSEGKVIGPLDVDYVSRQRHLDEAIAQLEEASCERYRHSGTGNRETRRKNEHSRDRVDPAGTSHGHKGRVNWAAGVPHLLITNLNRAQLLALLPKGGIAAEVGVYKGSFAEQIRRTVAPAHLHLIDPWGIDADHEYVTARRGRHAVMLGLYDYVQNAFHDDIERGRVTLHRDYSTRAAATFPDGTFDFIYIDAMHDYENVRNDLLAFKDKLKPDGFLLGHDFSNNAMSRQRAFGVVKAVREFVQTAGFELVLVTNEAAPTYLLARSGNDTTLPRLRQALLDYKGCSLIEIDDALLDRFEQVAVQYGDGRAGLLMRFG